MQERVLITGAGGNMGRMLRTRLAAPGRNLRLLNRSPLPPPLPGEAVETISASVTDFSAILAACEGYFSRDDAPADGMPADLPPDPTPTTGGARPRWSRWAGCTPTPMALTCIACGSDRASRFPPMSDTCRRGCHPTTAPD